MIFSPDSVVSVKKSFTDRFCRILLIITGSVLVVSAHAQTTNLLPDDLRVTLIHPEEVSSGETINLFIRVDNIGNRVWSGLNTHLDNLLTERYMMRNCTSDCGPHPVALRPGQTNFFFVGTLYPFEIRESVSVLPIHNLHLSGSTPDSSFFAILPPADIAVNYSAATDPLNQPIPPRQSLQPADFLEPGDNLLVHDPNTGADWLRLDASRGYMPQEILAALEPGGILEDFRVARASDVENALPNHIHANGIAASRQQLYWWPREELYDTMAEFITLMQSQRYPDELVFANGFVADKSLPWLTFPALSALSVSIGFSVSCADDCEFGIKTQPVNAEQALKQQLGSGVWLVRGIELPARPLDQPSYFDGELWIPDVKIDGTHYHAILKLTDARLQILQLTELSQVEATDASAEVDSMNGSLTVPNVKVMEAGGSSEEQSLDFVIVPGSSPQALLLTTSGVLLD